VFSHCQVDQGGFYQGGAIFFDSILSGESFNKFICAYSCNAFWGHFAVIGTSYTLYNVAEYVSVSSCYKNNVGYRPFFLFSGYEMLKNCNSSMNKVIGTSGITAYSPLYLESIHCTFSNNDASEEVCLYLHNHTGFIKYSNIVHNNSPLSKGVIYMTGDQSSTFSYCEFYRNRGVLFYADSSTYITFFSCVVDHKEKIASGKVKPAGNNTDILKSAFEIIHIKTGYCHAEIPITDLPRPSSIPVELCSNTGLILNQERNYSVINCEFISLSINQKAIIISEPINCHLISLTGLTFYNCISENKGTFFLKTTFSPVSLTKISKVCAYENNIRSKMGGCSFMQLDSNRQRSTVNANLMSVVNSRAPNNNNRLMIPWTYEFIESNSNFTKCEMMDVAFIFETQSSSKASQITQCLFHDLTEKLSWLVFFSRTYIQQSSFICISNKQMGSLFSVFCDYNDILFDSCVFHLFNYNIDDRESSDLYPSFRNCMISGKNSFQIANRDYFLNNKYTHAPIQKNHYFSSKFCQTNLESSTSALKKEDYISMVVISSLKIALFGILKCIGKK